MQTRIYLSCEETSEFQGLEGFLRKLGFDVILSSKQGAALAERVLAFNPQALILGVPRGLNQLEAARGLRDQGYEGGLAISLRDGEKTPASDLAAAGVDGVLRLPVKPEAAIELVAELLAQDPAIWLARFEKLQKSQASTNHKSETELVYVRGKEIPHTSYTDPKRKSRNQKFLEQSKTESVTNVLPKNMMAKAYNELEADSSGESKQLEDLLEAKKKFVKEMFKKKN